MPVCYYKNIFHSFIEPECEKNVNRCIDGECTCRDGYLPNDCCLCKDGYYLDQEDKECKSISVVMQ